MKLPHLRWWIAGLLFLASVLNYIDRQALSILAPTIQADLALTDADYGRVVSLFLVAYTIAYLLSGRLVDKLGSRASLALFVGWWSLANMATGLARGAASLGACRFLLGLGEAGGYTASPKVVSEWFSAKDRGIAVGLYSMGGAVGATLAPVLVIGLASDYGWRGAFFVTGLLGLGFAAFWLLVYRPPAAHPWLTAKERAQLPTPAAELAPPTAASNLSAPAEPIAERKRWLTIFTHPAVWALMAARLLTDPIWYFFQFWMPKYLHAERGFAQLDLARMWLIFLAADVGFLASGFLSGKLVQRGRVPATARLGVMFGCALLVPAAALIPGAGSVPTLFALAMVVVLAHAAWLGSISTLVVDLVPAPILGTAFGFIAAASAVGGILMNQAVTWTIQQFSYAHCFYAMILPHPLAFAALWCFARQPWRSLR